MGPQQNGFDLCGPYLSQYGIRQCANANVLNVGGAAFSGISIPSEVYAAAFNGGNSARLPFSNAAGQQVFLESTDLRLVPEPATLALVGAALLGVAATRRSKASIATS